MVPLPSYLQLPGMDQSQNQKLKTKSKIPTCLTETQLFCPPPASSQVCAGKKQELGLRAQDQT